MAPHSRDEALAALPIAVARARQQDGSWRLEAANEAAARLLGSSDAQPLASLAGSTGEATLTRWLDRCASTGAPVDERLELRTGGWHRVIVGGSEGRLTLTVLEEPSEDALRTRLRHFESIAENSPDIIARLDRDFRHVYVNRAILDATGATAAHFIGKDHRELGMPEELTQSWQSTYRKVFETGLEGKKEFEFPTPSGVRSYSSRVVPEVGADGTIETVLSVARDVTALKQAVAERLELERKLHQSQRLESLGILAGGIAHDFNNLLSIILGTVAVARHESPFDALLKENLDHIEAAGQRAAELCAQMLAYAGKGQFVLQNVDVDRVVAESAELLRVSVSKKVALALQLHGALPLVRVDRTQLQQVVVNLVMNASEAMGDREGRIHISSDVVAAEAVDLGGARCAPEALSGRYVRLAVTDDGSGMDAEVLARIFEPFYSTKFAGRGLGLSATLGIVRSHDGVLTVHSAPGQGTTFVLLLPALDEAKRAPEAARPEAALRLRGSVLVVDDEEAVRGTVVRLLESRGISTLVARDGREALEIVAARRRAHRRGAPRPDDAAARRRRDAQRLAQGGRLGAGGADEWLRRARPGQPGRGRAAAVRAEAVHLGAPGHGDRAGRALKRPDEPGTNGVENIWSCLQPATGLPRAAGCT